MGGSYLPAISYASLTPNIWQMSIFTVVFLNRTESAFYSIARGMVITQTIKVMST